MKQKVVVWLLGALMLLSVSMLTAQETVDLSLPDVASTEDGAVTVADNVLTIAEAGVYHLTGAFDGQVVVDVSGDITLVLDSVSISNDSGPALLLESADTVQISLPEGSSSTLTGASDTAQEDAENATLYSAVDLSIVGPGALIVESAAFDSIVSDGALTISEGAVLNITAGDDAISVETIFTLTDGELTLTAGGGAETVLPETTELSAKGLKAKELITIEGGKVTIDAADDAINSDNDFVLNAGELVLSAVGKGVHADYNLTINGGKVSVLTSDEGLEAGFITINDGDIHILALDDGINVSEPDDIQNVSLYYLYINGGYIVVDAEGDGIDSNGSIEMNGGVVIVNGPGAFDNGALDYDGIFAMNAGLLIAAGSAGMPAAPGSSVSSQPSVMITFDEVVTAGTLVHIADADGESVLTFESHKDYQSLVVSSPALADGETYTVYTGGSSDGSATDGLYVDGTYTAGDEIEVVTLSGLLTQVGESRGGFGPRGGGRPEGFGGGQPPEGFGGGQPPEGAGMPPATPAGDA